MEAESATRELRRYLDEEWEIDYATLEAEENGCGRDAILGVWRGSRSPASYRNRRDPPPGSRRVFACSAAGGTGSEQKIGVQRIENAVLAPGCYTEPVSRYQGEVAVRMRIEIAKRVAEGRTDQET